MTGLTDSLPVPPAPPDDRPVPVTRPRGRAAVWVPLPVAVGAGLAAGAWPQETLLVAAAVVTAVVLVVRVEWAALAVVSAAVFEGYLSAVSPWTTHWLAAVLVLAWLVRRARGPLHDHRLVPAVVLALGVVGAAALAFVVHPNGTSGADVLARYAELAVVAMVLADVLCGPLSPQRAARWYVLSCVAAAACGIVTAVLSDRHQVLGPLDNADTLAFFLVAAVPLVGTVHRRPDQSDGWAWACFAVLVVGGIGTLSKPSFVALVAMVLVAVLAGLLAVRHAGALIAAVLTGVVLVIATLPLPFGQAITDPQRLSETTVAQRNDARAEAAEMLADHPVLGFGPAAFRLFHEDYHDRAADADSRDIDTAYSAVLEVSAELGVVGLLAVYAAWLVPTVGTVRRWLRRRSRLAAGILLAMVGLLTASLLESTQLVLPLWFMAALAFAVGRPEPRRAPLFGPEAYEWTSGQVPPE